MIGKLLKLASVLLSTAVVYGIYRLAFAFPWLTETIYSRNIYPFLARFFSSLTCWFSFSLAEVLLYLFAVSVVFFVVYIICAFFRPKGLKLFSIAKRILSFLIMLCMLYNCFILFWGLNYARMPLADSMGLETRSYSEEELAELCEILVERTNASRENVSTTADGVFTLSHSREYYQKKVSEIYEAVAPDYMNIGVTSQVKGVMTKNLLSSTLTYGIFSPFTYEANINLQMPDLYFPAVALHEFAHLQGFAREDEANFIAWYLGYQSEEPEFIYSANVYALRYALNALSAASPQEYQRIYEKLDEGVKLDYQQNSQYWDQFETDFSEQSQEVYEKYLSYNGVEDGMQSYGRMLDLMLAYQEKHGF